MENFGKNAKDKITGFKGVITGRCDHLGACTQYLLTPTTKENGELAKEHWFEEERIEFFQENSDISIPF